MSVLRLSSSAKGSAVMSVSSEVLADELSGWSTATLAQTAGIGNPGRVNFIMETTGNPDLGKCSVMLELKGPSGYKWKGTFDGNAKQTLQASLAANDIDATETPAQTEISPYDSREWTFAHLGTVDMSVNGVYVLSMKVNGAPNNLVLGVVDSAGIATLFKFNGFSHAEATVSLTKA